MSSNELKPEPTELPESPESPESLAPSVFAPPVSEIITAEELAALPNRRGRMIVLGILFGVLLRMQWIRLPIAWLKPVIPALRPLVDGFLGSLGYEFATAILFFISTLPNTLTITVFAALAIRKAGHARAVLYGSLLWPSLIFVSHWLRLMSWTKAATRLGWDASSAANLARTDFAKSAILIVLVYGCYLLLVVTLLRLMQYRRGSNRRS